MSKKLFDRDIELLKEELKDQDGAFYYYCYTDYDSSLVDEYFK